MKNSQVKINKQEMLVKAKTFKECSTEFEQVEFLEGDTEFFAYVEELIREKMKEDRKAIENRMIVNKSEGVIFADLVDGGVFVDNSISTKSQLDYASLIEEQIRILKETQQEAKNMLPVKEYADIIIATTKQLEELIKAHKRYARKSEKEISLSS